MLGGPETKAAEGKKMMKRSKIGKNMYRAESEGKKRVCTSTFFCCLCSSTGRV